MSSWLFPAQQRHERSQAIFIESSKGLLQLAPVDQCLNVGASLVPIGDCLRSFCIELFGERCRACCYAKHGTAQIDLGSLGGGGTADPLKGGMAVDGKWISTYALIVDKHNNLYVGYFGSDIIKITPEGRVSAVAGGKDLGYTPDGSKAMGAKLGWVYGLAFDANDHLYFSEYNNHHVRMIDGLGLLRTVAGSGIDTTSYKFDCPALQATLSTPESICFDAYNNMYIISDKYDAVLKVSK